jgi:dolichyl-phosphate-mannose-protein mannosyltransferase
VAPHPRTVLWTCLALTLVAQLLFLINIQFPRTPNFDEFHYIPSAKQFLEWRENQNWEHPPLGKMIMAVGIGLWGDRPIGWRYMSTLFGALTLTGMYLWALALFRNQRLALWVAGLTLFNQLLYVQARIGMLDTFMFAFLSFGCAAFCAAWDERITARSLRAYLLCAGLCFGLATATKWFGVVPWFSALGLVGVAKLFQFWGVSFTSKSKPGAGDSDWFSPALFQNVNWKHWVLSLVLLPTAVYFLTFVPLLFTQSANTHGLWDLILMQKTMYEGQLRVVANHPYMSRWTDWAILKRPIWYAFDKEGPEQEFVRGVLLLGNPLIMWGGLIALLVCLKSWVQTRSRAAFLILFFYGAFYFSWAVIPRKISFYYYYYPAGMVLSLALAWAFVVLEKKKVRFPTAPRWAFLGLSAALFVYFLPILAALRIDAGSFKKWMWMWSWI